MSSQIYNDDVFGFLSIDLFLLCFTPQVCVVSELSGHALNLQLVIAGVWCSMAWSQREQVIHWESVWIFLTYKKYIWIEADCNIRFDAV